ncbi:MAG: geranylgeranylglycerol-phosphate geranylgeranyltransferase [Fibrobacterota bacterium]
MKTVKVYLKLLRMNNALIAAITVALGFWLSESPYSGWMLVLLMVATISATGFGNVINDIQDIDSDRISHPQRPLPKGDLSIHSAKIFSVILIFISLACGFSVSITHGLATLIPLLLLILYARFLKATPLAGNIVVALLVAYSILYGSLNAPGFSMVIYPALFAFLLNISREMIKDIQDEAGDKASGVITSAVLPHNLLRSMVYCFSIVYLLFLIVPYYYKVFSMSYLLICLAIIIPLHVFRSCLIMSKNWKSKLSAISTMFKVEMVCGLAAIAVDHIL